MAKSYGKTTGIILSALGDALTHPNKVVRVISKNQDTANSIKDTLDKVIKRVKLDKVEVVVLNESVVITSRYYGLRDDGTPAEGSDFPVVGRMTVYDV